jgi:polar amino acid transport system substrate-binding protein
MKKIFPKVCKLFRNYWFFFVACFLFFGCSTSKKTYKVAIDPSWFPLELYNKEPYVLAFSEELLHYMGEKHGVDVQVQPLAWDNLLEALAKKKVQGILSSMEPYVFNQEKYRFSENYLNTGPVLIVRIRDQASEHDLFQDKEIATFSDQDSQVIAEEYPQALARSYDSSMRALLDLVDGNIDAVFMNYLEAHGYVNDIYHGLLKIISAPLTQEGLKLITMQHENHKLISMFNETLNAMKKNGDYDKLLKKWKLAQ